MAKRRKHNGQTLPERVYPKHGSFWYVDAKNKWHKLAKLDDYSGMLRKLADIIGVTNRFTMLDLWERYERDVLPTKGELTQRDNRNEWSNLVLVFGNLEPQQITTQHVYQYIDYRGVSSEKPAPVRANREKALLSNMLNYAKRWGYMSGENPCHAAGSLPEKPRDRYITDEELIAFRDCVSPQIRCYVDLKYLTGMRQGDILALRWNDIKEDGIHVQPQKTKEKTGTRIIVEWSDDLRQVISDIKGLSEKVASMYLFHTRTGGKYSRSGFQSIWQRAMKKVIAAGILTERFTEHDIRAKALSDADTAGHDAQKMAGHADSRTTRGYLRSRQPSKIKPVR